MFFEPDFEQPKYTFYTPEVSILNCWAIKLVIYARHTLDMTKISKEGLAISLNLNSPSKLAPSEQLDGKYFLKEKNF